MSSSSEKKREEQEKWPMMQTRQFESMFDSFRREMERMMTRPWSYPMEWEVPSLFESRDMRMALYEMVDRGDRFELQLEVPGVEKENVDIKATKYSVEISGKHSEKSEEKGKKYVYSERMYRFFLSQCAITRRDNSIEGLCQSRKWHSKTRFAKEESNRKREPSN